MLTRKRMKVERERDRQTDRKRDRQTDGQMQIDGCRQSEHVVSTFLLITKFDGVGAV